MLKIYRKNAVLKRKYYNSNELIGEVKNRIFFKKVECNNYKLILNKYVDIIFYLILFFILIYCLIIKQSLFLLFFMLIIELLLRYVYSFRSVGKVIKTDEVMIGYVYHILFSNKIKIMLGNNEYEVYSHGENYFSVMVNNMQIALINTNGKIIMNELCFTANYLSDYLDILVFIMICIDFMFYKNMFGKKQNPIFSNKTTFNIYDKHKERLIWENDCK